MQGRDTLPAMFRSIAFGGVANFTTASAKLVGIAGKEFWMFFDITEIFIAAHIPGLNLFHKVDR